MFPRFRSYLCLLFFLFGSLLAWQTIAQEFTLKKVDNSIIIQTPDTFGVAIFPQITPDGRYLSFQETPESEFCRLRVCDLETERFTLRLIPVFTAVLVPNRNSIVLVRCKSDNNGEYQAPYHQTFEVRNLESGELDGEPISLVTKARLCASAISPDETIFAVGSLDTGDVYLFDIETRNLTKAFRAPVGIDSLCFADGGRALVMYGDNLKSWEKREAYKWDLNTKKQIGDPVRFDRRRRVPLQPLLSEKYGAILTGYDDEPRDVQVLDTNRMSIRTMKVPPDGESYNRSPFPWGPKGHWEFRFAPDGRVLAFGSKQGEIKYMDCGTQKSIGSIGAAPIWERSEMADSVITPTGTFIATFWPNEGRTTLVIQDIKGLVGVTDE